MSSEGKFKSSPIQMEGVRNSMRSSIEQQQQQQVKLGDDTKEEEPSEEFSALISEQEKYKSSPIKLSLRNSLRTSIASKRGSMTHSELKFVQDMLEESLGEEELESMDMVLKCDKTFFHHNHQKTLNPEDKQQLQLNGEPRRSPRRASAPVCLEHGSMKRQAYLEARRRQSEDQLKKRSKALWKKATVAARTVGKLSVLSKLQKEDAETIDEEEDEAPYTPETQRKIVLRRASTNVYEGEGFEIGEEAFGMEEVEEKKEATIAEEEEDEKSTVEKDQEGIDDTIRSFSSLTPLTPRGEGFRRASVNIYGGSGFEVAEEDLFEQVYDGETRKTYEDYDPWLFQEFDKNGKRREFTILGTDHDDTECHPHVLSPVQMDRFQPHLPDVKKGESFWLKYSLVRDGASMITFLKQVRASPYTLLAMETVDGEVFGGFFASPWTVQPEHFGTGDSFLWRMKHRRRLPGSDNGAPEESLVDQIEHEADLEIFPSEVYYGNNYFQMCHQDKISSGGGTTSLPKDFGGETYKPHEIGFGLQLGEHGSLLQGSSSASLTFRNPPLSKVHSDGSIFEVLNLEAWGFTPCQTEEEARILEYKNMFFKRHSSGSISK